MQKILLLGAGRSSSSLIDYLLKNAAADDYTLTVADLSVELALQKTKNHPSSQAIALDIINNDQRKVEISAADIVISLLPPSLHYLAAKDCVECGKHLLTASYVSDEIAALSKDATVKNILLLNECGLDPGIDHMSAMEIIDRLHENGAILTSFKSYTGELITPESRDNPWGYKFTWNPRNVILAGQGTAKYIEKGKYKYLPYNRLFKKIEKITIDGFDNFDGYANRDSLSYRNHYRIDKIPTLIRGTLRNENFCKAWDIFVQLGITDDSYVIADSEHLTYSQLVEAYLPDGDGNIMRRLADFCHLTEDSHEIKMIASTGILDDVVIGMPRATPAQILQHLLTEKWKLNVKDKDMIVMKHLFEYTIDDAAYKLSSTLVVIGDDNEQTAMAKTVGYPLGIIARMLLQNKINLTGVQIPVMREIYQPVLKELGKMGIKFQEA